tara:strand:- start:13 stop:336 length:324 start_codon:yes stop_codon:yes gene_type:complete
MSNNKKNYKELITKKNETKTLPNKCSGVRIQIDGKAYRAFSLVFNHPSGCNETNWVVLSETIDGGPILIDKQTLSIMAGQEIQWLTEKGSIVNTEPTILAVELTQKN